MKTSMTDKGDISCDPIFMARIVPKKAANNYKKATAENAGLRKSSLNQSSLKNISGVAQAG
jgi:hypothetical protein